MISNDRKIVSRKIVEDPKRPDYTYTTRMQPLGLKPEFLGGSSLARATGAAATELWHGNLALDAHLRAIERSMGAEAADDIQAARERAAEARTWARHAGVHYVAFSEHAPQFAEELEALDADAPVRLSPKEMTTIRRAPRTTTFEEVLPPEVLALLYRIGIPIRRLRNPVVAGYVSSTPIVFFASLSREAGKQSARYGHFMRGLGGFERP